MSLEYSVNVRKKWGLFAQAAEATLTATVVQNEQEVTASVVLPGNFRPGREFESVEQTLYNFIAEVVHAEVQRRRSMDVRDAVDTIQEVTFDSRLKPFKVPDKGLVTGEAQEISAEAVQDLILSVIDLSGVTSLTYEGFLDSQRSRTEEMEKALHEESGRREEAFVKGLIGFMELQGRGKKDTSRMQLLVLDHLEELNEESGMISKRDARQIVEHLVPQYMRYRKARADMPTIPDDIISHALGSLIVGAIGGALVGGLIVEPLVDALFKTHVNVPSAEIATGLVFVWPYLSYPFRLVGAKKALKEQRESLGCGLSLSLQPKDKNLKGFDEFADEFRARAEKERSRKK